MFRKIYLVLVILLVLLFVGCEADSSSGDAAPAEDSSGGAQPVRAEATPTPTSEGRWLDPIHLHNQYGDFTVKVKVDKHDYVELVEVRTEKLVDGFNLRRISYYPEEDDLNPIHADGDRFYAVWPWPESTNGFFRFTFERVSDGVELQLNVIVDLVR